MIHALQFWPSSLSACRQIVGQDCHAVAIIGAENLKTEAEDFGIEDTEWAQTEEKSKGSKLSGATLDPTAVVINSEHVRHALHETLLYEHG